MTSLMTSYCYGLSWSMSYECVRTTTSASSPSPGKYCISSMTMLRGTHPSTQAKNIRGEKCEGRASCKSKRLAPFRDPDSPYPPTSLSFFLVISGQIVDLRGAVIDSLARPQDYLRAESSFAGKPLFATFPFYHPCHLWVANSDFAI